MSSAASDRLEARRDQRSDVLVALVTILLMVAAVLGSFVAAGLPVPRP